MGLDADPGMVVLGCDCVAALLDADEMVSCLRSSGDPLGPLMGPPLQLLPPGELMEGGKRGCTIPGGGWTPAGSTCSSPE